MSINTPDTTPKSNFPSGLSFKQFADLARRRGWTVDELVGRFNGRIERATEFFSRVMSGKFQDTIVPFRSVIEFYQTSLAGPQSSPRPTCGCGCGRVVFDRRKWATPGCKKRTQRQQGREAA